MSTGSVSTCEPQDPVAGDKGCVKVLWSLFERGSLFKFNTSVSPFTSSLVCSLLFTSVSLELVVMELLSLLPFTVFELVQVESKESTLKDILCLRNTGAASVLFTVQDCVTVAAEGVDVEDTQFPALIAWVMVVLCTCSGYV
jgi:hypothetical protein